MNRPTKDLFDDTSMTFGEHLEVLRVHLLRAIYGLVIAVVICLLNGTKLVNIIRAPIDRALSRYSTLNVQDDVQQGFAEEWGWNTLVEMFTGPPPNTEIDEETGEVYVVEETVKPHPDTVKVRVPLRDIQRALHRSHPQQFPKPPPVVPNGSSQDNSQASTEEGPATGSSNAATSPANATTDGTTNPANSATEVVLTLHAPEFAQFQATVEQSRKAITLNVQEAFLTYIKVSLISGLVLSSPWTFYQLWLFVAAGLYPHERRFVYVYGTMSLALFLIGAAFCFYAVFPFVLNFLLKFNASLQIAPQIRISEWISFAIMLPIMFGISFQLPLAMLFLERISIFEVQHYREQYRMAILVIAVISMLLTPADPMSMLLMMFPLIGLYHLGIKLCEWSPAASPFDAEPLT